MKELILKLLRRFKRLITYGIMGVLNTIVDYMIFAICYELGIFSVELSQDVGFMAGSVCGYLLNSNVTFSEGKGRTKAQFIQYVGVDLVLAYLSGKVMKWVETTDINVYLAKVCLTAIIALLHYTIYKYLVFRIKKEDSEK